MFLIQVVSEAEKLQISKWPKYCETPYTLCSEGKNGRTVYRSSSERYYLYYHDWGSNQGSNWVISQDYNRTEVWYVILTKSPWW